MKRDWSACRKILCIRPDNMGDLLMSSPALRALKTSFNCHVTVLTSTAGAGIARFIPEIDDIIRFDLPWVKQDHTEGSDSFLRLVETVKQRSFDAAIIFTVYSQNPLPSVMLAYLAGIPRRLAYCRENPYELLTHWVPDKEPYDEVKHQVVRDLLLVKTVGATTSKQELSLKWNKECWQDVRRKLMAEGVNPDLPWLIMHAGVSEKKREFPADKWVEAGRRIIHELKYQVILTGGASERGAIDNLNRQIGAGAFSLAGILNLEEFISLVANAPLLITVNSGPAHIAAATQTPVLVLYALTNPQHLPWKVKGKALYYDVPETLKSKNQVIRFVDDHLFFGDNADILASEIVEEVSLLLSGAGAIFPELVPLRDYEPNNETVSLNTR